MNGISMEFQWNFRKIFFKLTNRMMTRHTNIELCIRTYVIISHTSLSSQYGNVRWIKKRLCEIIFLSVKNNNYMFERNDFIVVRYVMLLLVLVIFFEDIEN